MTVTALEYIQAELLKLRASRRDLFVPLPSPIQPNRNRKAEADLCRCEVGAAGKPQGSSNHPKKRKAVTSVTGFINSGADYCAKGGDIRPAAAIIAGILYNYSLIARSVGGADPGPRNVQGGGTDARDYLATNNEMGSPEALCPEQS